MELIDAVNLVALRATCPPPNSPMAASARWRSPPRWRSIPPMLLLDEPMAGMGHEDIGRISELIRRIAADRTVLMVEHNLSRRRRSCATASPSWQRGEILADGDYDEVSADPRVREAYMGTEHD